MPSSLVHYYFYFLFFGHVAFSQQQFLAEDVHPLKLQCCICFVKSVVFTFKRSMQSFVLVTNHAFLFLTVRGVFFMITELGSLLLV